MISKDKETAEAFATSWNNLPDGSVYNFEQFEEWLAPISKDDVQGKSVLELGCGNGSLMFHLPKWSPYYIEGVDLGASVLSCKKNMRRTGFQNFKITKFDLTQFESRGFDFVYCIGVLHHLKNPFEGFKSVLKNTKPNGKFHCWVYAKEGNAVVIYLVEPIRKITSKLPWWITKYLIATPLIIPYYFYAKLISRSSFFKNFPLYEYSRWIARREFLFFRHVAFDQLVTPQTTYVSRENIEKWFKESKDIQENSTYIIFRNGNSWKFGGVKN